MNHGLYRLIWKEFRHQVSFWCAGLGLSLLVLLALQFSWKIGALNRIAELSIGFTSLYIIAALAIAFSGERELGTYKFLSILPVRPSQVAFSKIVVSAVGAINFQLVLIGAISLGVWGFDAKPSLPVYGSSVFHLFVLSLIEFFFWGLLFSTSFDRILKTTAAGIIASYASLGLLIGIVSPGMTSFDLRVFDEILIPRLIVLSLLCCTSIYSVARWCRTLRGKAFEDREYSRLDELTSRQAENFTYRTSSTYSRLIWMSFKRQWRTMLFILLVGIYATLVVPSMLRIFELPESIPIVGMFILLGIFAFRFATEKTNVAFFGRLGVNSIRLVNAQFIAWLPAFLLAIIFVLFQQTYSDVEFAGQYAWKYSAVFKNHVGTDYTPTFALFELVAFHGLLLFFTGALVSLLIQSTPIALFSSAVVGAIASCFVNYCYMLSFPVAIPLGSICISLYLGCYLAMGAQLNQQPFSKTAIKVFAVVLPVILLVCVAIPAYRMMVEPGLGYYRGTAIGIETIFFFVGISFGLFWTAQLKFLENFANRIQVPALLKPKFLIAAVALFFLTMPICLKIIEVVSHVKIAAQMDSYYENDEIQIYEDVKRKNVVNINKLANSHNNTDAWTEDSIASFNRKLNEIFDTPIFVLFDQHSRETKIDHLSNCLKSQINQLTSEGKLVDVLRQRLFLHKLKYKLSAETALDSYADIKAWARDPRQTPATLKSGINLLEQHFKNEESFLLRVRAEYFFRWEHGGRHPQLELTPPRKQYLFCSSPWEQRVYFSTVSKALFSNHGTQDLLRDATLTAHTPAISHVSWSNFGHLGNQYYTIFDGTLERQNASVFNFAFTKLRRQRLILVELALVGWRLEFGAYPAELDQLVPSYFKSVPLDPVSQSSFYYSSSNEKHHIFENTSTTRSYLKTSDGPFIIEFGERQIDVTIEQYVPESDLFEINDQIKAFESVKVIHYMYPTVLPSLKARPAIVHPLPPLNESSQLSTHCGN